MSACFLCGEVKSWLDKDSQKSLSDFCLEFPGEKDPHLRSIKLVKSPLLIISWSPPSGRTWRNWCGDRDAEAWDDLETELPWTWRSDGARGSLCAAPSRWLTGQLVPLKSKS
ncbi:hypothetical protein AV530_004015 [Patagioenas fasciata monilis]|uniref:Uncharacterized protein n=1 Tax=Patagioenas fasciata monilis TaxID=372326 RepID=A0A1V4JVY8_PATFA|nr:hypothetical protein AV530_004015 [Patagioenas fasciata monilis]